MYNFDGDKVRIGKDSTQMVLYEIDFSYHNGINLDYVNINSTSSKALGYIEYHYHNGVNLDYADIKLKSGTKIGYIKYHYHNGINLDYGRIIPYN